MTRQLIILISALTSSLTICAQTTIENNDKNIISNSAHLDTSKIAIFLYDKTQDWLFKNCKPSNLTDTDYVDIERILMQSIEEYNKDKKEQFDKIGDLLGYKRQYIAITNAKGEKEVWVNCFCSSWDMNWKSKLILVKDGGSCFFSLKINLTKGKYYELTVNGNA